MLNEYDKLIQDLWNIRDTHKRLMPNSKYDFNDYILHLVSEIKQYCRENNISFDDSTLHGF